MRSQGLLTTVISITLLGCDAVLLAADERAPTSATKTAATVYSIAVSGTT